MSDDYERIKSEIEIAEETLKSDIVQKEMEAESKIDEILSKKKIDFCTRCGAKVESNDDWAGKCLFDGCNNLLCKRCWIMDDRRFCKKHATMVLEEGKADKKFFKEEPEEPVPVQKPAEAVSGVFKQEDRVNKIKNLTERYTEFMKERIHKFGVPNWVPYEFIKKVKFSIKSKEYGKFNIKVYKRGWLFFFKKTKMQILIRPLIITNVDELLPDITEKIGKAYTNIVYVSDTESCAPVKQLFEKANYDTASLFLIDTETNTLYFNRDKPVTEKYSYWFDPKQMPFKFKELLKRSSDIINDRHVVATEKIAKEFGTSEEKALKMLEGCNFLSQIKGTNSFLFKKYQKD
jgi:hypothetical protein